MSQNLKGDVYGRAISKAFDLFPACVWIGGNEFFVQSTSSFDTYHVILAEDGNLEGAACTCLAAEHPSCVHRARAFLTSPARTWYEDQPLPSPVVPELALAASQEADTTSEDCPACEFPGLEYEHTQECSEAWMQTQNIDSEHQAGGSCTRSELPAIVDSREVQCGPICRNANRVEELCWNCYADFEVDMLHELALEVGLNAVEKALAAPGKAA